MEYYNILPLPEDLEKLVFKFKIKMEKDDHQKFFQNCIDDINQINHDTLNVPTEIWGEGITEEIADDAFNNVLPPNHQFYVLHEQWGNKSSNMIMYIDMAFTSRHDEYMGSCQNPVKCEEKSCEFYGEKFCCEDIDNHNRDHR
mgnify:CR=1 FL=1